MSEKAKQETLAVEFNDVGKVYRLYPNRWESFLDVSGLSRLSIRKRPDIQNFWALRGISFKLAAGSRIGIVGRNGAGKTTLLKLMTGNVAPTEGSLQVNGEVQALLEAGAGFHPEFTGYENVEASLIQNGLTPSEIKEAIEEIAEFTELGEFLNQPFKAYSAGMQARLVFTTATTVNPDILIVDEILGAGDAYFAAKSRSRMRRLVESGATILLVSHALDQITQFCEEAIWLERGRIVMRGASLEVVKAYEEFIHDLQDRQLRATNRRRHFNFRGAADIRQITDTLTIAVCVNGPSDGQLDISRVELRGDDVALETLRIGDTNDTDQTQFCHLAFAGGDWSDPREDETHHFRSIRGERGKPAGLGEMVFQSVGLDPGMQYSLRLVCRSRGAVRPALNMSQNLEPLIIGVDLPVDGEDWQDVDIPLPLRFQSTEHAETESEPSDAENGSPQSSSNGSERPARRDVAVRRWAGEGTIVIEDVLLRGSDGEERAVFRVGDQMTISLKLRTEKTGSFPLICGINIFRLDGIPVAQDISEVCSVDASAGELTVLDVIYDSLNLANGTYVVSVSIFRSLDADLPDKAERYDLLDRSFQFEIVGNKPIRTGLIEFKPTWNIRDGHGHT